MRNLKERKRLNNKGFTLIELLAVVVILAIVMGISATSVLNSINNSRKSSLYSAAQTAASNMNTWVTEDFLITANNDKKLGDDFIRITQTDNPNAWICLTETKPYIMNKNGSNNTSLLTALSLSSKDIKLGTMGEEDKDALPMTAHSDAATDPSCSAIRYNTTTAAYEVVLVSVSGGKYYVSSDSTHFAYSAASEYNKLP